MSEVSKNLCNDITLLRKYMLSKDLPSEFTVCYEAYYKGVKVDEHGVDLLFLLMKGPITTPKGFTWSSVVGEFFRINHHDKRSIQRYETVNRITIPVLYNGFFFTQYKDKLDKTINNIKLFLLR